MRPSRNAFIGYTYQQVITYLLLVLMDVERKLSCIEMEAETEDNFDQGKHNT